MTTQSPEPRFIDNPHAPDFFADAVTGSFLFSGVLRLTFERLCIEHSTSPGPANRVVIGRLVMPLAAAENLRDMLIKWIENYKANPSGPPQGATIN